MSNVSDHAICLRRWDFSETSQTVSLLTRDYGVVRGLAKGAKRERGSFSGGFDVLTAGHVVAIVKPGRDLAILTEWKLQESFRGLRGTLAANRAALYMADLTYHMVTDHDPHPGIYVALVEALHATADDSEAAPRTLLEFQWRLLDEAGYRPRLTASDGSVPEDDDGAVAFSATAGGVVSPGTPGSWRVRRTTLDLLGQLDVPSAERELGSPVVTGDAPGGLAGADVTERANRLLATYVREILGEELPTTAWTFGGLS